MGISYADAVKAFQNASAASATNVPAVSFAHDWQSNNLDRTTAEALLKVDQALAGTVPGLTVTSAYRPADYNAQVGGAQSSQHISGKAIDLDLSSFTPAQRQAVLQAVMAQPEIKGIGVYDKNLNTLHFDTRAGERVAWGPDYTTKSLGSVLNGFTQPMLTGWLNGSTPSAPTQSASVAPPKPNLLSTALAFQGVNPYDAAPPAKPPSPTLAAFAQPPGPAVAPPAPTQTASSWLPPSLQPGGQGFADVLGSQFNHATTVPNSYGNMYLADAGPYGIGNLLNAITAGAPQSQIQAIGDQIAAQVDKLGLGGKLQALGDLTNYIKNTVPQQAPGTVRYLREQLSTNPALAANVPAPLKPALDAAFKAQLPAAGNVPVAMPNLRPPMPQQAPTAQPPLVAGPTPDPLAPKMASFSPPPSSLPFAPGDNLDVRTDGEGNASPIAYQKPAPDAAGLAQLLARGGQQSGPQSLSPADQTAMQGPAGMPSPSAADAGLDASPRQYWTPPASPPVTPASVPVPSANSLNPTQMRGLEGPTGQGKINFAPLMAPGMPNFGPPPGFDQYAYDPLADASMFNKALPKPPTAMTAALAQPQRSWLPPRPPPVSPLAAALAGNGPAPQNVNWAATMANDPYAQPGTQNTFVLNDLGSYGPRTTPLQQAYDEQGGDSYLSYPAFSFGL